MISQYKTYEKYLEPLQKKQQELLQKKTTRERDRIGTWHCNKQWRILSSPNRKGKSHPGTNNGKKGTVTANQQ